MIAEPRKKRTDAHPAATEEDLERRIVRLELSLRGGNIESALDGIYQIHTTEKIPNEYWNRLLGDGGALDLIMQAGHQYYHATKRWFDKKVGDAEGAQDFQGMKIMLEPLLEKNDPQRKLC